MSFERNATNARRWMLWRMTTKLFVVANLWMFGVTVTCDAFHTRRSSARTAFSSHYERQQKVSVELFAKGKGRCSTKNLGYMASNKRKDKQQSRWERFLFRWKLLRQCFRQLFHRTTVYVLKCEHDKFYVGSTTHPRRRFKEHFENPRGGSKWTSIHRPLEVETLIRRVPQRFLMGCEAQITANYMLKYGINNVRGAYFTNPRSYTTDDISRLVGFLGHYGKLDFKKLEKILWRTLPQPRAEAIRLSRWRNPQNLPLTNNHFITNEVHSSSSNRDRNKSRRRDRNGAKQKKNDVCYKCGQRGHWAYECSNSIANGDLWSLSSGNASHDISLQAHLNNQWKNSSDCDE